MFIPNYENYASSYVKSAMELVNSSNQLIAMAKQNSDGIAGETVNKAVAQAVESTGQSVGVGQPGTLESFIPVWGSGRAAIDDFQNGNIGWGLINSALAISDVFLVKAAVTAIVKGSITIAAKAGTNLVYKGFDSEGVVRYIGITERHEAERWAEHKAAIGTGKELLNYRVIEGATGLSRLDARIWEQTLINEYKLGKNGGLLLNKINSIAPKYWWMYGIKP